LIQSDTVYTLTLSNITASGTVEAAINIDGYSFTPQHKSTTIYKHSTKKSLIVNSASTDYFNFDDDNDNTIITGLVFDEEKETDALSVAMKDGTFNDIQFDGLKIGDDAFYKCKILSDETIDTTITFNGNNVVIDDYAFFECAGITSINALNSNTTFNLIGERAFYNCKKLSGFNQNVNSIAITEISNNAFYGCESLTYHGIKVNTIGDCEFVQQTDVNSGY
jgi:hypothetical protein